MSFDTLGLHPEVLRAVSEAGYEKPTPIQEQAIPKVIAGRDVLGIAQTGTGKTASFTLPMLTILAQGRSKARMPRTLILEPTRELAAQVADSFEVYGKHLKLSMALLIGGVSFADQEAKLNRGVDVLIATPGRLLDHFERGKVLLTGVQILVVDEADRMLDMGFIPDVERICKLTPFTRQTLFFSATMPPEIQRITSTFLTNPVKIEVARASTTAETVAQSLIQATRTSKRGKLIDALKAEDVKNAIVFCNRKRDVGTLAKALEKAGFTAGALHGDLDQSVRMKVLDQFKTDQIQILVASDVAARGLDIPAVSHVVNYDVPIHPEDYVHRIGRTGRAGKSGKAITIATEDEAKYVDRIEKLIQREIPREGGKPAPVREAAADAESAPAAPEDKGREEKGRGRSGRSRPGAKAEGKRQDAPTPEPQEQAAPAAREKPARQDRKGDRRDRDRGRDRDRDEPVKGLGDHVPDFLLRPVFPTGAAEKEKPAAKTKAKAAAKPRKAAKSKAAKADTPDAGEKKTSSARKPSTRRAKKAADADATAASDNS